MNTINRDLNIPVKQTGDEVNSREFNTMVDVLKQSVCAVRCTKAEYDAMASHDRLTMYFVDDSTTGDLLFWYLGDQLLCRNASAVTTGFAYTFPITF